MHLLSPGVSQDQIRRIRWEWPSSFVPLLASLLWDSHGLANRDTGFWQSDSNAEHRGASEHWTQHPEQKRHCSLTEWNPGSPCLPRSLHRSDNHQQQQQLACVGSSPQPPHRALGLHNVAVLMSGAVRTPVCSRVLSSWVLIGVVSSQIRKVHHI